MKNLQIRSLTLMLTAALSVIGCNTSLLLVAAAGFATGLAESIDNRPQYQPPPPTVKIEKAYIHKELKGGTILVEREIWGKWIIEPKGYCSWVFLNQGKWVNLRWNYPSATLISPDGKTCDCWVKDELK